MWLSLLSRFWPYLAAAAGLIAIGVYLRHTGYESGYAASEAQWQQRFAAAEKAREVANEKARRKEADSRALSEQSEIEHAKNVASLNLRAADAERRYASLLRNRPASPSCIAVPKDGGAAAESDATTSIDERADRAGRDFSSLAQRCEADAATLDALQKWVRGQSRILNEAR